MQNEPHLALKIWIVTGIEPRTFETSLTYTENSGSYVGQS